MIFPELYTRKGEKRLDVLKKRMAYLNKRVSESPIDLTYDKQEASALNWVIRIIEQLMKGK